MNKENADLGRSLAEALEARSPEIVGRLVETYRHNPGYQALDLEAYEADLLPVATANERLLARRLRGLPHDPRDIRIVVESAVRRYAQGVPESEVMRAYRLWSMTIWTELTEIAKRLGDVDPEALVELAAVVLEHNEFAGGLAADAYEAEQNGIWVDASAIPEPLVTKMLAGTAEPASLGPLETSHLGTAGDPLAVLLIAARTQGGSPAEKNSSVRSVLADWRGTTGGRCIVMRHGGTVITIARFADAEAWATTVPDAEVAAVAMAMTMSAGGLADALTHYPELRGVLEVADILPPRRQPFTWRDTLLESLLRSAPDHIGKRLGRTLQSLLEYEEQHDTPLLQTFAIYLEEELSVTSSANRLFCHPNTVRYRLGRIESMTGLDPRLERDRAILSLATVFAGVGPDRVASTTEAD
jgi:hypothetical protein